MLSQLAMDVAILISTFAIIALTWRHSIGKHLQRFKKIFFKLISSKRTLMVIVLLLPLLFGLQIYNNSYRYTGKSCKQWSNYMVFKYAHHHLLGDQDLYNYHHAEHCYTYKYSPSFALFFGAFAYLPTILGLMTWMLLTGVVTYFALISLPGMGPPKPFWFLLFISSEWIVCVQGQQTNALIAAMLILAFVLLERGKELPATLLIVLTGFIKIFGFGAVLLFLFYPKKLKLALYTLGWTVLVAVLPLIVLSPADLFGIYENWYAQITGDYAKFDGMSFYSLVNATTGWNPPKTVFAVLSLGLMLAPLVQLSKWKSVVFRKMTLAAILVWVVIFNHKAESPTYIIAMMGMGIWFFSVDRKWWDHVLMWFAFLVVSILFSDFVPEWMKYDVGFVYHLKALPCLLVWMRILVDLWLVKANPQLGKSSASV
jgi:hypothetical protein